jgi:hypothetical protein
MMTGGQLAMALLDLHDRDAEGIDKLFSGEVDDYSNFWQSRLYLEAIVNVARNG